jgi:hypothetical protein
MEGYERKNKKEIHKELQDIYPISSPHMEEILIGENVDPYLLFFPSKLCKNHGKGRERESKASRSTMKERDKA